MRPAPLFILSCWLAALAPACAQDAAHDTPPAGRIEHFVDFRARPGALVGHTFIVYGRVDARGMPVEIARVGFYPDGEQTGLIVGSLVPVRGRVRAVAGDFTQPASAIYRRRLSAAEYSRVKTMVARLRAREHTWHIVTHNCNDFGIAIARELGLITPPNLLVPNAWVRALAALNGG